MDECRIGPIAVARATFPSVFAHILVERAAGQKLRIGFCNAHMASLALKDRSYSETLSRMLLLNDGIGLDLAARLMGEPAFPENLNGTDFVPRFLAELRAPQRIFLLGGKEGVAERVAEAWSERFPDHRIVGTQHGYFAADTEADMVRRINDSGTDILLVALGNPRQESFIVKHSDALHCGIAFGVGALFDFAAGRVVRAPPMVRTMRLEWLFRLAQEPRRLLKRYTVEIGAFLLAVAALRFRGDRST